MIILKSFKMQYVHELELSKCVEIRAIGKDILKDGLVAAYLRSQFADDPVLIAKIMRTIKDFPEEFYSGNLWSHFIESNTNSIIIHNHGQQLLRIIVSPYTATGYLMIPIHEDRPPEYNDVVGTGTNAASEQNTRRKLVIAGLVMTAIGAGVLFLRSRWFCCMAFGRPYWSRSKY